MTPSNMVQTRHSTGRTNRVRRWTGLSLALSLVVHAGAMVVLRTYLPAGPAKTDVVGESSELVLGFDLPPMPSQAAAVPEAPATSKMPPIEDTSPPEPPPVVASAQPTVEVTIEPEPPAPLAPVVQAVDELTPAPTPVATPAPAPAPTTPKTAPETVATSKPEPTPSASAAAESVGQAGANERAGSGTAESAAVSNPAPSASFAGVKADRARKVVYAVDVSGAMVADLKFVLEELERNVARLEPDQQFQVVLFRDPLASGEAESASELPDLSMLAAYADWVGERTSLPALVPADAARKSQLRELVRKASCGGPSNPLTGLRLAISMKPDVVFLLSRSIRRSGTTWGPGDEAVMTALDKANPVGPGGSRAITIRTIQFGERDPSGLMDRIAAEHGGERAVVLTLADLRKRRERSPRVGGR